MTNLGLPVPPGFTISTDACKAYMAVGDELPAGLMAEVAVAREQLEQKMGKKLGDAADPLLVSVRSGAPFSMPGMMDTVLNLGLNDESVKGLAKQTQNERFAYDSYRRFVQMFGKIVLDVPGDHFEEALHELVEQRGVSVDTELTAEDLAGLVETFKGIVKTEAGVDFPTDPQEQLRYAIEAVFKSWNGRPARLPQDRGDPRRPRHRRQRADDGVRQQGRRLGHRRRVHPQPVDRREQAVRRLPDERAGRRRRGRHPHHRAARRDGRKFPEPHKQLLALMQLLENHYRDMCDIEFTIEQGRLFMLQTRVGKRTAAARCAWPSRWRTRGSSTRRKRCCACSPRSSTSCCTRSSTRRRSSRCSPRA